jgi:hypothetical protein
MRGGRNRGIRPGTYRRVQTVIGVRAGRSPGVDDRDDAAVVGLVRADQAAAQKCLAADAPEETHMY